MKLEATELDDVQEEEHDANINKKTVNKLLTRRMTNFGTMKPTADEESEEDSEYKQAEVEEVKLVQLTCRTKGVHQQIINPKA